MIVYETARHLQQASGCGKGRKSLTKKDIRLLHENRDTLFLRRANPDGREREPVETECVAW